MKKFAVRAGSALLFFVTINFYALSVWTGRGFSGWGFVLLALLFFAANLRLPQKGAPSRRIEVLDSGGELLKLFLSNPGIAFTRHQLFSKVWGEDFCGESRTIDTHILTLRQKLGPYGDAIKTVRNVGYRLEGKFHAQ